jgi:hypothetical protein
VKIRTGQVAIRKTVILRVQTNEGTAFKADITVVEVQKAKVKRIFEVFPYS